jgi:hypothetical protein
MGEGRQDLADLMAVETGEASVSLDAGKAQLPFVSAIAGKPAIALTVAAAAVVVLTACGSSPGSRPPDAALAARPYPIITLSDAQIAKIRG